MRQRDRWSVTSLGNNLGRHWTAFNAAPFKVLTLTLHFVLSLFVRGSRDTDTSLYTIDVCRGRSPGSVVGITIRDTDVVAGDSLGAAH